MTKLQSKRRWRGLPRRMISLLIVLIFAALLALPSMADNPVTVVVNGKTLNAASSFERNGVTYVPVRAFAETIGNCRITWDPYTSSAGIITDYLNLTVYKNRSYQLANGRCLWRNANAVVVDGSIYAPLTVLATAYGADVSWNGVTDTATVSGAGRSIARDTQVYDSNDLLWLARIIQAEASGESFNGKLAVGNVILNRVASSEFPNTIYNVIFDRKWGVQFSPTSDGSIYNTPSTESYLAAKAALEGYTLSSSILYFLNPRIAQSFWITSNRPYAFSIGNHDFYR